MAGTAVDCVLDRVDGADNPLLIAAALLLDSCAGGVLGMLDFIVWAWLEKVSLM